MSGPIFTYRPRSGRLTVENGTLAVVCGDFLAHREPSLQFIARTFDIPEADAERMAAIACDIHLGERFEVTETRVREITPAGGAVSAGATSMPILGVSSLNSGA